MSNRSIFINTYARLKKIGKYSLDDDGLYDLSTQYVTLYKTYLVKFKVKDKADFKSLKAALEPYLKVMQMVMCGLVAEDRAIKKEAKEYCQAFFGYYKKGKNVYVTWYLSPSMKSEAVRVAAKDFASVLDREANSLPAFAYETENGFKLKDKESKNPNATPIEV